MRKYKRGQGFRFGSGRNENYGLIWNVDSEGNIEYFEVSYIVGVDGTHISCYDDPDSVYSRDKDNVHILDCPPPFTDMGIIERNGEQVGNVYALADVSHPHTMNRIIFDQCAIIVDSGVVISDRAMAVIKDHPWPKQAERELVNRGATVDDDLALNYDSTDKCDFDMGRGLL